MLQYLEKPVKKILICSGIAAIEPHVLCLIDKAAPIGLDELVEKAITRLDHRVTHWLHHAFWIDVNDPDLLQEAETGRSRI